MQPANCLNCGKELSAEAQFCPKCGQKAVIHRISLKEIGHETVHFFTHADKGIFHLLKELALRPGKVAREFIQGKRKKYFPPINFILIVAAVCLFSISIVQQYKPVTSSRPGRPAYSQQGKPQQAPPDPAMIKRGINVGKFFSKFSNLLPITAVPLLSFIMWLFYYRNGFNYAEHFTANMYIGGFSVLLYAVLFEPLTLLVDNRYYVLGPYFLFEIIYRSFAYYHFINKKTKLAFVKSLVANLVVILFWMAFTTTLITAYIQHGFWGLLK